MTRSSPPAGPASRTPSPMARSVAAGLIGALSLAGLAISLLRPPLTPPAPAARPEEPSAPPAPAEDGPVPAASPALVNLNTASAAELEALPGIGPALAARILEERARRGGFRSIADLDAVPGIGPRTLEKLRPLVFVPAGASDAPPGP